MTLQSKESEYSYALKFCHIFYIPATFSLIVRLYSAFTQNKGDPQLPFH